MLENRTGRRVVRATGLDPGLRQEILDRHARLGAEGAAQTLGVPPGSDRSALRAAFVALAKRFHPDSAEGADSELRPVTAARAHGRLSEPDRPRPRRGLVSRLLSIAR